MENLVATLSLVVIGIVVAYFSYLQVQIARFSENRNDKFYIYILLACFVACNVYFYVIVDVRFPLDLFIMVGYGLMISFFVGFSIIYKRFCKLEGKKMKEIDHEFQDKGSLHEFLRKFFHFFVFFGSLLFVVIYVMGLMDILRQDPTFGAIVRNPMWEDSFLADLSVDVVYDNDLFFPTTMELAMMVFFMIALPFSVITEYFRLNERKGVPFQLLLVKSLRPHEQNNAADYYYFTFGVYISTFFLPLACVFGVLCVLCFGDTFASLIGKRIDKDKKHHIRWESEKCWEGAIAGLFFTFITAIFFVGWILALVLGTIFLISDCLTPRKIKISDNILNPLLCTLILFIILAFGFQINAPINTIFNELNSYFIDLAPELIWD